MKVALFVALAFSFVGGKLCLPVGQEKSGQDLATRCVAEILSKALSKADAPPVHEECRDFLRAGLKYEMEKKSVEAVAFEGTQSQEQDEAKRQGELTSGREGEPVRDTKGTKDMENFLKAIEENEHHLQNEGSEKAITSSEDKSVDHHTSDEEDGVSKRSHHSDKVFREGSNHPDPQSPELFQEQWGDQKERSDESEDSDENTRGIWGPAHGYHHKKHRRSGDSSEDEVSDESKEGEDSEEGKTEDRDKRIWKPTHRYHHKKHRRSGDSSEGEASDESEEGEDSEEGKTEDREKRIWKPTHRYHHKKHRRSGDSSEDEASDESEEGEDSEEGKTEDRDKRIWKPTHRYHHKKHRQSGDLEDEHHVDPEEDEEKQIWNPAHKVQGLKDKRKRGSFDEEEQDLQKRGYQFSEDERRFWKPTHIYYQNKHKRNGESSEEEVKRSLFDEGEEDEGKEKMDRLSDVLEDVYKQSKVEDEDDQEKRRHLSKKRLYTYGEEKQHYDEDEGHEGEEKEAPRYLVQKGNEEEQQSAEKEGRSPWVEKEYHQPAWWKHSIPGGEMGKDSEMDQDWWDRRQVTMETFPHRIQETRPPLNREIAELARLLNYKKAEMPGVVQPQRRSSLQQRPLTPEEENELENLAAMDMELQKIAEEIHEKQRE